LRQGENAVEGRDQGKTNLGDLDELGDELIIDLFVDVDPLDTAASERR
jgi:hypothetical protein